MTDEGAEFSGELEGQTTQDSGVTQQGSSQQRDEVFTKETVNRLVHERTREASQKAYERAQKEAAEQYKSGMGGMSAAPTEEKLLEMMEQVFTQKQNELHKSFQEQETRKQIDTLANEFMGKIESGKEKYPSLKERQDEIGDLAMLVPFINETSEVAGIANHLLENEGALAQLLVLRQTSPSSLRRAITKIEAAIKQNDASTSQQYPEEPLNHISPSHNAMDSGSSSIDSLKKQDWLRG